MEDALRNSLQCKYIVMLNKTSVDETRNESESFIRSIWSANPPTVQEFEGMYTESCCAASKVQSPTCSQQACILLLMFSRSKPRHANLSYIYQAATWHLLGQHRLDRYLSKKNKQLVPEMFSMSRSRNLLHLTLVQTLCIGNASWT